VRCGKDACAGGVVFGCDLELEHRADYTIFETRRLYIIHGKVALRAGDG
jgi:hypothetical protein